MNNPHYAEPIDRSIRHWETSMLHAELGRLCVQVVQGQLIAKRGPQSTVKIPQWIRKTQVGPATHWRTFRQHLLRIHSDGFDYEKYS